MAKKTQRRRKGKSQKRKTLVPPAEGKVKEVTFKTSCSLKEFHELLKTLTETQVKDVEEMGFGKFLEIKEATITRGIIKRLASRVNIVENSLTFEDEKYALDEKLVGQVMGLPSGQMDILRVANKRNRKREEEKEPEHQDTDKFDFRRTFVRSVLAYLLCPASYSYPKKVDKVLDYSKIQSYNWRKFVLDSLMDGIRRFRKKLMEKPNTENMFHGPVIFLQFLFVHHWQTSRKNPMSLTTEELSALKKYVKEINRAAEQDCDKDAENAMSDGMGDADMSDATKEDEDLALALKMPVQDTGTDPASQTGMSQVLGDQSYMPSILTSLPGVDPKDPSVRDLLASQQAHGEEITRFEHHEVRGQSFLNTNMVTQKSSSLLREVLLKNTLSSSSNRFGRVDNQLIPNDPHSPSDVVVPERDFLLKNARDRLVEQFTALTETNHARETRASDAGQRGNRSNHIHKKSPSDVLDSMQRFGCKTLRSDLAIKLAAIVGAHQTKGTSRARINNVFPFPTKLHKSKVTEVDLSEVIDFPKFQVHSQKKQDTVVPIQKLEEVLFSSEIEQQGIGDIETQTERVKRRKGGSTYSGEKHKRTRLNGQEACQLKGLEKEFSDKEMTYNQRAQTPLSIQKAYELQPLPEFVTESGSSKLNDFEGD